MDVLNLFQNESESASDDEVRAYVASIPALADVLAHAHKTLRAVTDYPLEIKYYRPGEEGDSDLASIEIRVNLLVPDTLWDLRARDYDRYVTVAREYLRMETTEAVCALVQGAMRGAVLAGQGAHCYVEY